MGCIVFVDKDVADKIATMGFKYEESITTNGYTLYKFIDTPELRNLISSKFANTQYTKVNTVCC